MSSREVLFLMDNKGEWEKKNLINELMQGRELAKQLQAHFQHVPSSSSSSHEMQEPLIFRILLSYDRALSMLSWNHASGEPAMTGGDGGSRQLRTSESPPSLGLMSGDSDQDNKEHEGSNNNNYSGDSRNNRKAMPRWTKQARVIQGAGIEGQLDDGHSWRKYGQKDILGAKYPRGYYRCTHRSSQGCLAMKQIQRSDEDSTVFEITYRGTHTCNQNSVGTNRSSSLPENNEANDASVAAAMPQQQQQNQHQLADLERQKDNDALFDFCKSLAMITDDGSSKNPLTAFCLPSISDDSQQLRPPFDAFNFPEASTGFDLFRENQNFRSPDNSEFGLVLAASDVATSSGTNPRGADARGNLDFPFDPMEFNNSFGNRGFFPK